MSFMKKMLASVGIGSARVNTKLNQDEFVPGQQVSGIVEIAGGNVEQQIDGIYLSVKTTYEREVDDKKVTEQVTIGEYQLTQPLMVSPNEKKEIPFSFELPLHTPITIGKTKVWVQIGLDIKMALDPADRDYITVKPYPLAKALLDALSNFGFHLRQVECEQATGKFRKRLPFIQEFEFSARSGPYRGKLDELEVIFFPTREGLEVFMEIDRKARGIGGFLAEALKMDESRVHFTVTNQDLPSLSDKLYNVINRHS